MEKVLGANTELLLTVDIGLEVVEEESKCNSGVSVRIRSDGQGSTRFSVGTYHMGLAGLPFQVSVPCCLILSSILVDLFCLLVVLPFTEHGDEPLSHGPSL